MTKSHSSSSFRSSSNVLSIRISSVNQQKQTLFNRLNRDYHGYQRNFYSTSQESCDYYCRETFHSNIC